MKGAPFCSMGLLYAPYKKGNVIRRERVRYRLWDVVNWWWWWWWWWWCSCKGFWSHRARSKEEKRPPDLWRQGLLVASFIGESIKKQQKRCPVYLGRVHIAFRLITIWQQAYGTVRYWTCDNVTQNKNDFYWGLDATKGILSRMWCTSPLAFLLIKAARKLRKKIIIVRKEIGGTDCYWQKVHQDHNTVVRIGNLSSTQNKWHSRRNNTI